MKSTESIAQFMSEVHFSWSQINETNPSFLDPMENTTTNSKRWSISAQIWFWILTLFWQSWWRWSSWYWGKCLKTHMGGKYTKVFKACKVRNRWLWWTFQLLHYICFMRVYRKAGPMGKSTNFLSKNMRNIWTTENWKCKGCVILRNCCG